MDERTNENINRSPNKGLCLIGKGIHVCGHGVSTGDSNRLMWKYPVTHTLSARCVILTANQHHRHPPNLHTGVTEPGEVGNDIVRPFD